MSKRKTKNGAVHPPGAAGEPIKDVLEALEAEGKLRLNAAKKTFAKVKDEAGLLLETNLGKAREKIADIQAKRMARSKARAEAKIQTLAEREVRIKAKAEAEAQAQAEREARLKAKAEIKTEAEARTQAEKESRIQARVEARAIEALDPPKAEKSESVGAAKWYGKKRWSALICIGTPVLIASIYYGLIASNQYVSTAGYSIVTEGAVNAGSSRTGSLGSLLGGGGGSMAAMGLQFIVQDYIGSQQMLEDIRPFLDVRKIYTHSSADWWARANPNVTDEKFINYWRSMVTVHFDMMTGLSEIKVRAFTPEDAKAVADRVLFLSEALVNRLSERARRDAVQVAKDETQSAYDRVIKARDALQAYSQTSQQISPEGLVKSRVEIQSTLESELVVAQAELNTLRKSPQIVEDAVGIRQLKNRIAVIQSQLDAERTQATRAQGGTSPAEIATAASKLQLENEFASQAYLSALEFQESVQLGAISKACYLEAYIRPLLPQYPLYPQRFHNVLLTALVSAVLWAIGSLIVAAIRQH